MRSFLYVAADNLSLKPAETLRILSDLCATNLHFGIKVNLDYVLRRGYETCLGEVKKFERPLFVDLKMFNGKRTMKEVARVMVDYGVDFFNVMALGDSQIPEVVAVTRGTKTKVLAVTVLTHFDEAYCEKHFRRTLAQTVRHLGETALDAGCEGIILPGTCLWAVENLDMLKVVPGVRPKWYKDSRHEEEIEPTLAKENGADIMVCGSPIMKAANPQEALRMIISEIQ